jgi:hypothetical protein
MSKKHGRKKNKNTSVKIKELEEGDRFELETGDGLKGVILHIGNMETHVYWYSIPDRWFKKHYDEETLEDEDGNFYEGLDTYFYKKKMAISSSACVKQITD